jgi:hypothetical protein
LEELNRKTAEKLAEDRRFWDDTIQYMLPNESTDANSIIRIADALLEARRERFGS